MFDNRNEHANERLLDSESIHAWTAHTSQRNNWDVEDSAQRWCEKQGIIGMGIKCKPGLFAAQADS